MAFTTALHPLYFALRSAAFSFLDLNIVKIWNVLHWQKKVGGKEAWIILDKCVVSRFERILVAAGQGGHWAKDSKVRTGHKIPQN